MVCWSHGCSSSSDCSPPRHGYGGPHHQAGRQHVDTNLLYSVWVVVRAVPLTSFQFSNPFVFPFLRLPEFIVTTCVLPVVSVNIVMTENRENAQCVVKKKCCMRLCEDSLIEKVKLHPHLYDINSIDYKDSKKCVNTWLVIANELGQPGEWKICKERWRTLRDVYVRNKRSMTGQVGGEGCTKKPKWKFFDQMDFLAPHVNHRPWKIELETLPSLDSGR